jgi:hypothetical protein
MSLFAILFTSSLRHVLDAAETWQMDDVMLVLTDKTKQFNTDSTSMLKLAANLTEESTSLEKFRSLSGGCTDAVQKMFSQLLDMRSQIKDFLVHFVFLVAVFVCVCACVLNHAMFLQPC